MWNPCVKRATGVSSFYKRLSKDQDIKTFETTLKGSPGKNSETRPV
jgi:hypothetical protein